MIGRMPRAALRGPLGTPYSQPHPGGPVGGGYSAPGPGHRSLHTDEECTRLRHEPGQCVAVLVVDLEHPDAVRRGLDHLSELARSAT